MSALADLPFEEIEDMMRFLAAWHGVGMQHLRSARRQRECSHARRCCYQLLRARGWSYKRIARYFNKNPTSVFQALHGRPPRTKYHKAYHARRAA